MKPRIWRAQSAGALILRCAYPAAWCRTGNGAADSTGITPLPIICAPISVALRRAGAGGGCRQGARDGASDRLGSPTRRANDFALAEATLRGGMSGGRTSCFINGIAVAGDRTEAQLGGRWADGVRQLITNQEEIFQQGLLQHGATGAGGSDSQGLRYGTTGTPSSSSWRMEGGDPSRSRRDTAPSRGAARPAAGAVFATRLACSILIRNFIIFDAGHKKVPRPTSFRREGGAGAHRQTRGRRHLAHQGSGKAS